MSRVWIDAAEDDALVGWLYWPDDGVTPEEIQATVNGAPAVLTLDSSGRPDVAVQIGVSGCVHGFRVGIDILHLGCDEPLHLSFSARDVTVDAWMGTAGALMAKLVSQVGRAAPSDRVAHATRTRFACAEPPPGRGSGAVTVLNSQQRRPSIFFEEQRLLGPRGDLAVSSFQHYSYCRHVREHPGYRADRSFPVTTRDGVVSFLVWSLRMFAVNYPYASLPFGAADAELLNSSRPYTGLAKGRSVAAMRSRLCLTAAQEQFVSGVSGRVDASGADEYADWLVAWLASWGWGHKALHLLTPEQKEFLAETSGEQYEAGTIGALTLSNRYLSARLRAHPGLAADYRDVHLVHVRIALLCELAAADVTELGSDALLPAAIMSWLRGRDTIEATSPHDAAARRLGPEPSPAVRVMGMLQSRSGLGQNARLSVAAVRAAGLECDEFGLAINDATAKGVARVLAPAAARVNIWHLNPDNLPEAVCTLSADLYEGSYNIGFFAWELDLQPRSHQLALDWVDEIWVPSAYCAESFRTATDKPIVVMPHAIEVPDGLEPFPRQQLGVPDDAFLVHCSFDMNSWPARKNPLGVVEVFRRAFDDADARLLLKIRHGATIGFAGSDRERHGDALLELAEDDERILIDIAERSYADTLALIATSNCHISLHRSEGFGYSLAEAMALGVPLLCTDFGGSRDFCTPANSWLVPAVERYLEEGEYWLAPAGATWGEPSLDTAVDLLRQIRAGGAEVQQKLAAARERAASLGLGQMSERYGARLAELLT